MIVGAIKAATTWLTWQLQRHPDIFLPDPEPHYFTREFERGENWYAQFFSDAGRGQIVGEKTADYLANPHAAARIAARLPHIPLIVQLRDPVERAYSDYCMLYRRGTVGADPSRYLDPRQNEFQRFLDNGLYARHLRRWFALFDRSQFEIILFEDVRDDPDAVIASVLAHLGVDPLPVDANGAPANDSKAQFLPLPLRLAFAPLKQVVAPLRGNPVFEAVRAQFAKPIAYPPLTAEMRKRLEAFYAPEVEELSRLLDRSLDHWAVRERRAA